jgi:hypothetical protein
MPPSGRSKKKKSGRRPKSNKRSGGRRPGGRRPKSNKRSGRRSGRKGPIRRGNVDPLNVTLGKRKMIDVEEPPAPPLKKERYNEHNRHMNVGGFTVDTYGSQIKKRGG